MRVIILFLLLIPFTFGFNCENTNNPEECKFFEELDQNNTIDYFVPSVYAPDFNLIGEINNKKETEFKEFQSKGSLRDVSFMITRVEPRIIKDNSIFITNSSKVYSDFTYQIKLPENYYSSKKRNGGTCKIKYYNDETIDKVLFNDQFNTYNFILENEDTIHANFQLINNYHADIYEWDKYCCRDGNRGCKKYCYKCKFEDRVYYEDKIEIEEFRYFSIFKYPNSSFCQIRNEYYNTTKLNLEINQNSNLNLIGENSNLNIYNTLFKPVYNPYPYITYEAINIDEKTKSNLIEINNSVYLSNQEYTITETNYFNQSNLECIENQSIELSEEFENEEMSLTFLLKLGVLFFVLYLIFIFLKTIVGKILLLTILLIPFAYADDHTNCSFTNIGSCLPEKFYNFFMDVLNSPIEPLLNITKSLISESPNVDLFKSLWRIMAYMISFFYGLLLVYSGFIFIMSGGNFVKREIAKEWFYNIIIMIVCVNISFYLYKLILNLGSVMTKEILDQINPNFFLLTIDNLSNIGLELLLGLLYAIILIVTVLLLVIRYLIVSFGVLFVPLGIFFYFIPPLRDYGIAILRMLGLFIFISFFISIIILGCSMILEVGIFSYFKILVMICCFIIVDAVFFLSIKNLIFGIRVPEFSKSLAKGIKYTKALI